MSRACCSMTRSSPRWSGGKQASWHDLHRLPFRQLLLQPLRPQPDARRLPKSLRRHRRTICRDVADPRYMSRVYESTRIGCCTAPTWGSTPKCIARPFESWRPRTSTSTTTALQLQMAAARIRIEGQNPQEGLCRQRAKNQDEESSPVNMPSAKAQEQPLWTTNEHRNEAACDWGQIVRAPYLSRE